MGILDTLITDRTGGHYGTEDLNRVGEAMLYVAKRLRRCGLLVSVAPRTDWAHDDMMRESDAAGLLDYLRLLRQALGLWAKTPPAPDGGRPFNVEDANDIERILLDIDEQIALILKSFRKAGTFCAGEGFQFTQIGSGV